MNKKKILFVVIFAVLGLLALQIPIAQIKGSKAAFTLFDTFGPIATSFIGTIPGIIAVFLMQLFNFLVHGANVVDTGTIIRFFPMLFAAMYFGKRTKLNLLVPITAIIVFNLNDVGRSAWYYSLFWLIPIACYFFQNRSLLASALGATFTAHAVGGAAWVWALNLTKEQWTALIPIVAMERAIFALGIAGTYLVFNNILNYLVEKQILSTNWGLLVNPKYVFRVS